jgi:hypothetical protein
MVTAADGVGARALDTLGVDAAAVERELARIGEAPHGAGPSPGEAADPAGCR